MQRVWYSDGGSRSGQLTRLTPPVVSVSLSLCAACSSRPSVPLSISQSIPTISVAWAGLFVCARICVCVCVCVPLFHGLSESSAISCIVLPLIEPKSGPLSGIAVCSAVCVWCVCVCLAVFPELHVPQDHRLASTVLLHCVCVRSGATTTGRTTVSKERCVYMYVCAFVYVCLVLCECVRVCMHVLGVGRLWPFLITFIVLSQIFFFFFQH